MKHSLDGLFYNLSNQSTIEKHMVCFQSFISVLKLLDQRVYKFLILKLISKLSSRDCTSEYLHQGCVRASVFTPHCQSWVVSLCTLALQHTHLQERASPFLTQHAPALLSPRLLCLSFYQIAGPLFWSSI